MKNIIKEIQKKTVASAKQTKGLNFNLSCYEGAASFGDALELFFKNLNRDLKELLDVHKFVTATSKRKILKKELVKKIVDFYVETATVLNTHIEDFAGIMQMYNKLQTAEQKQEIQKKRIEFASTLESSFSTLRKESERYLILAETLPLGDIDNEIVQALKSWKKLTFASFVRIITSGEKIPWISSEEQ
jgi:hypothetical protein